MVEYPQVEMMKEKMTKQEMQDFLSWIIEGLNGPGMATLFEEWTGEPCDYDSKKDIFK